MIRSPQTKKESLESRLKEQALHLGFDLVGIARATSADGFERFQDWLDHGFAGQMDYMHRHGEARRHPSSILAEVRTVVMVGLNHAVSQESSRHTPCAVHSDGTWSVPATLVGRVARYAWSDDYHDVLRSKLKQLLAWIQEEQPDCRGRAVVDTAPLLERDFARRAGLGWHGKNTMLLNKEIGSYFFLGALLLDLDLEPDLSHDTSHCGTCTACLDACPTNAFPEPGVLDSRRCISYLTIELREAMPLELRADVGDWVFGCDVCQEVCPWNRKAPGARDSAISPHKDLIALDLIETLEMSQEVFNARFHGSALMRTKRSGLRRNAAIVLGNVGDTSALPALQRASNDPDPMLQEAARWAIERVRARGRNEES